MGDYSPHVLELARENVSAHAERVSSLVLDATRPTETLGFLRDKAFLVYISNVYDNLPTDEIVRIGGHLYQVEVRAVHPAGTGRDDRRASFNVSPERSCRTWFTGCCASARSCCPRRCQTSSRTATCQAVDVLAGGLGRPAAGRALRAARGARHLPTSRRRSAASCCGPIVEANGDVRMHVSNGAAASFADYAAAAAPARHAAVPRPVRDGHVAVPNGFRGPGKYDGSVVNWVNGPLLAAIGPRRGFDVTLRSLRTPPGLERPHPDGAHPGLGDA